MVPLTGAARAYQLQLAEARRALPLLKEVRKQARDEKRDVVARVLLADDTIACVKAGPRGGLKILGRF